MKNNFLMVMCGIPASGKSTMTQKFVESGIAVAVSTDKIREELYGDESIQKGGKLVFNTAYTRIKELGEHNRCCVFDATNIRAKDRKKLVKTMRDFFEIIYCTYFEPNVKLSIERNAKRDRQVPNEVIERMAKNFQIPTEQEGFDYIIRI